MADCGHSAYNLGVCNAFFWLARDSNPLWLANGPHGLAGAGVVLVALALAQLRPREGIYRGIVARMLWGGSLAHFFIFSMCANTLVFIEDPREVGPEMALALEAYVFVTLIIYPPQTLLELMSL